MHQLLAEVLPFQHPFEGVNGIFEAFRYRFTVIDLTFSYAIGEQISNFLMLVLPLRNQEESMFRRILQRTENIEGCFHGRHVGRIVG